MEETPNHRVSPGPGTVGPAPSLSVCVSGAGVTKCLICLDKITFLVTLRAVNTINVR